MASIRCLTDTHFAVLSKKDFNKVLGNIERKKYNEKIQFLRSLPYFTCLTRASLGKLSYQFQEIHTIKDQVIYKEGDVADYVYLVKEGQFEVSRTMLTKQNLNENTKEILKNPLRSLKVNNNRSLATVKSNQKSKVHVRLS